MSGTVITVSAPNWFLLVIVTFCLLWTSCAPQDNAKIAKPPNSASTLQWIHPARCAIKNGGDSPITEVWLILAPAKWQTLPIDLQPAETKEVSLPDGRFPNLITVSWSENAMKRISITMTTNNCPADYRGDVLVTIFSQLQDPTIEPVTDVRKAITESDHK